MKKYILSTLVIGVISVNLNAAVKIETLTGDTKLACEAMLCLASPTKPSECSPSLARYFSIDAKKWSQVVAKRKSFLSLCPVDNSDAEMVKYRDQILVNLSGECSVNSLNKRVEKVVLRTERVCTGTNYDTDCKDVQIFGYRTDPNLTQSCRLLSQSKYTDYRLKYTCDGKFYEKEDWDNGYIKVEVSQDIYNALNTAQRLIGEKLIPISFAEFHRLPVSQKKQDYLKYYKIDKAFYKKVPIKKDCWINQQ